MASEPEEAPGGHRLVALGAVALLVAATAVAFGRVFLGHVPTMKLVLAGLASLALATALERRSPVIAAIASAAGLLLAVSYLVFPETLWYGLPSGSTVHAIGVAVQHVGEETRVQVAPTAPLHPLLLAAITAMWTAAFSSHALAMRSGSPLLAAVPCAALLAFAGIVMGDGPRRGYAGLFLLAVFAVLFADGLRRVRQWGPVRPRPRFAKAPLTEAATTRGARRVTFTALAVALLLPGLLPGFRSSPWLQSVGKGGSGPQVDPLVSITASLHRGRPIPLFTVQASRGVYWRWVGLDTFDGNTWTTSDLDLGDGTVVLPGQGLPPPAPLAAGPSSADVRELTQRITIVSSPGRWLPMAYAPESISVPTSGVRYDPTIAAAEPLSGVHPGLTYRVTSLVPEPTYRDLNRPFNFSQFAQYLQLPSTTKHDILPITRSVLDEAGNPTTPIQKILAIQSYFTSTGGFTYDTSVSGSHDTQSLVRFLTETKRGFCQQFAGAMAVMLRSIGIPARVAAGFAQGTFNSQTHTYTVSTAAAHSWVEVLFPGFGWVPFEPTPSRENAVTSQIVSGSEKSSGQGPTQAGKKVNGPGTQRDDNRPGDSPVQRGGRPRGHSRDPGRGAGQVVVGRSYAGLIALVLAILVGLAAVLIPLWKLGWRRRALRRARSPREITLAAFRVFASRAGDVGFGRRPEETLAEYRARLHRELVTPDGDLDRLTRIASEAAYAPEEPSAEDAGEAVVAARAAIASVRRDVPMGRRLIGVFRPRVEDDA